MFRFPLALSSLVTALMLPGLTQAEGTAPFAAGWQLDPTASQIRFLSVKKSSIAETSRFASFSGRITEGGEAEIRVQMDSVDTQIDLRNVRMRFLLFETFKFPEAVITADLTGLDLSGLTVAAPMVVALPIHVTLHGVTQSRTEKVALTLLGPDRVLVSNVDPVVMALPDFALDGGRIKLQEAAGVDILPFGFVSFSFLFDRTGTGQQEPVAAPAGSAALETAGNFDREACIGRFEILSRAGNIEFAPGSARLTAASTPLLDNLFDIVSRCPELRVEIAGHTDADGSETENQRLSERRAGAVLADLTRRGIPAERLIAVGYGEGRPLFANDSTAHKERNRRIEFLSRDP